MNTPRSISIESRYLGRPSIRERHRTTPAGMVGYVVLRSPGMGCPTNIGLLIREAGDSCGDEVASVGDTTGEDGGLVDDDSPGPRCAGPRLDGRALLALLRGTGDGARGPIPV